MFKQIIRVFFIFSLLMFLSFQKSATQIQAKDIQAKQIMKTKELTKTPKVNLEYGNIPLYFIPNEGQVKEKALFYAKASRYTLWLTKVGLVFDSTMRRAEENRKSQIPYERDVSRLIFLNANKNPEIDPVDITEHRVNYFIGDDESKWRTGISTSKAVLYKEIYKNIDLKIYGIEKQIEYDWVVKPGGDVSNIRFKYNDVKKTEIDEDGNIFIESEFSEFKHCKPVSYQLINRKKYVVEAKFKRINENTFGFEIEKYNKGYKLIIDPLVLVYSTYLGGVDFDIGFDIAVDRKGAAYVTGLTDSVDFPTEKPVYGTLLGQGDAFITKISSSGKKLIYSTYLGGSSWDCGFGIAVDRKGAAYVTGEAGSDFPTKNPIYPTSAGDYDAFISKINSKGNSLIYSTYLGGSGRDLGRCIAIDKEGSVYLSGYTASSDFPTKNPFQKNFGGGEWDVFVIKINSYGNAIRYSSYLGGSSDEWNYLWGLDKSSDIAIDEKGAVYVTGWTKSIDFPKKRPFQREHAKGTYDAFITKISSSGKKLIYSTYLGGSSWDFGFGIAVDRKGAAYVTGSTESIDFPIKVPLQSEMKGKDDVFIAKIKPNGRALIYSTYLGGSWYDSGSGIAVDRKGAVYVTGHAMSSDFPITNPLYGNKSGIFLTKLNSNGRALIYSTRLGGDGFDISTSLKSHGR